MMIYRTRYLAREAALSDEVVVKVEGGYMLVPVHEYKAWKHR